MTVAATMIRASSISDSLGRGSLAKGQNRASCELCADGRPVQAKWAFILFFEPFNYLRCGDRPFRQMRIECARADILACRPISLSRISWPLARSETFWSPLRAFAFPVAVPAVGEGRTSALLRLSPN